MTLMQAIAREKATRQTLILWRSVRHINPKMQWIVCSQEMSNLIGFASI